MSDLVMNDLSDVDEGAVVDCGTSVVVDIVGMDEGPEDRKADHLC